MDSPISDAYVRLTKVMRLAQRICVPKILREGKAGNTQSLILRLRYVNENVVN
jgi:hypothetical protein